MLYLAIKEQFGLLNKTAHVVQSNRRHKPRDCLLSQTCSKISPAFYKANIIVLLARKSVHV